MTNTQPRAGKPLPTLRWREVTPAMIIRPNRKALSLDRQSGASVDDVDRIVVDHAIMGGGEVLAYYPQLVSEDVLACVQYATRTGDEPEPGQQTPPSRDE